MGNAESVRNDVVRRLVAAGCVAADAEASELVTAAPDASTLDEWVGRRERGEPLAWITGRTWFCGRTLRVAAGVYVPRAQSEELARRAAALLPDHGRALDLCTGTGAVAVHLQAEVPTAVVVGVDADARAAVCARGNGIRTVIADLAAPVRNRTDLDVVTAVAPYVPTGEIRLLPSDVQRHEPRAALDGGADGLALVRRVVVAAARLVRPGGWLLLEVGADQDARLAPTLAAHGFGEIASWRDDDGDLRGMAARRLDGR